MTDLDPGQVMTIKHFNELRAEWMREKINESAMHWMNPTVTVRCIQFPPIQIKPSRIKAQQEGK